jgi:lysophospholipase L1-like esterase
MRTNILLLCFTLLFSIVNANAQPTIYLIGDSTMSNKKNIDINPERGWGQVLAQFFNENIIIDNHAVNGRSTKSFIDEGRWQKVKEKINPGDYVFIQFGHNDSKVNDPKRYANPLTSYRANLECFVRETRSLQATPILITPVARRNFNEHGVLVDTHGLYPLVVHQVAEKLNVDLIDLQRFSEEFIMKLGVEESKKIFLHFDKGEHPFFPDGKTDNTHFSEFGATFIAQKVAQELIKLNILNRFIDSIQ